MRALHWSLLLALLPVACSGARCHPREEAVAEPAPRPSAPPAASAPDPEGLAKITRPEPRRAFLAWAHREAEAATREGRRRRFTVEAVKFADEEMALLRVRERVEPPCRERLHSVTIRVSKKDGDEVKVDFIGDDCCPGAPCSVRPPGGYLFDYMRARELSDVEGIRRLIDPAGELVIESVTHDEDGTSEETLRFRHDQVTKDIFGHLFGPQLESDVIECPEDFTPDGSAICSAHGGGYGGSFEWERRRGTVYLRLVHESGH